MTYIVSTEMMNSRLTYDKPKRKVNLFEFLRREKKMRRRKIFKKIPPKLEFF